MTYSANGIFHCCCEESVSKCEDKGETDMILPPLIVIPEIGLLMLSTLLATFANRDHSITFVFVIRFGTSEIQLLQNAARRSTRPALISTFRQQVRNQTFLNSFVGGVAGGARSEGVKFIWNWFLAPMLKQKRRTTLQTLPLLITYLNRS
jgi:hypothetical protein